MKRSVLIVLLLMLAVPCLAFGQAQTAQPPKPGPEHQRLAALVGTWTTQGEAGESPFGPAEKWSGTIKSEWWAGSFAVVRHLEEKSSVGGEIRSLDVLTYDTTAKGYTWYYLDNQGGSGLAKGAIAGDVLTVVFDVPVKGKIYKLRGTLKGLGADILRWDVEYSEDGKVWKAYSHSTDTRVKAR